MNESSASLLQEFEILHAKIIFVFLRSSGTQALSSATLLTGVTTSWVGVLKMLHAN